tara:strand:+ start:479 stop:916 length:438 start_codon:yes stop_codon:yes gene_type:complete
MIDSLTTAASGGVLGLFGSLLSKGMGLIDGWQMRKSQAQIFAHEIRLLELQQQYQQWHQQMQLQSQTVQASYRHDTSTGKADRWVINLLRLVRPCLTVGLILCVMVLASADQLYYQSIADALLFCCTTAITWWFGDRAMVNNSKQ